MRAVTNSYKMRIALTAVLFTAMMPGWAEEDSDSAKPQQVTSNPPPSEAVCPTVTNKSATQEIVDKVNSVCAGAKKGNATLQAAVASIYMGKDAPDQLKPLNIPGNPQQVFIWTRAAAENGLPAAQSLLASLYAQGDGVEKDLKQAMIWLTKAAKNGEKNAQEMLKNMQSESKPNDSSSKGDSKSDDAGSDE